MTYNIIAIRGNHLDEISSVFECFKYTDLAKDETFDNSIDYNNYLFDNYLEFANREIALRGIWFENDWTIISDPEMTDLFKEEALLLKYYHYQILIQYQKELQQFLCW